MVHVEFILSPQASKRGLSDVAMFNITHVAQEAIAWHLGLAHKDVDVTWQEAIHVSDKLAVYVKVETNGVCQNPEELQHMLDGLQRRMTRSMWAAFVREDVSPDPLWRVKVRVVDFAVSSYGEVTLDK